MTGWIIGLSCAVAALAVALLVAFFWIRANLVSAGRMPRVDDVSQDPTPEPQWFFRRVLTYGVIIVILCFIGACVAMMPADDRQLVALALIGLAAHMYTIYTVGPSAREIAAVVAAWRGHSQDS